MKRLHIGTCALLGALTLTSAPAFADVGDSDDVFVGHLPVILYDCPGPRVTTTWRYRRVLGCVLVEGQRLNLILPRRWTTTRTERVCDRVDGRLGTVRVHLCRNVHLP
jgi:hypothetical protein